MAEEDLTSLEKMKAYNKKAETELAKMREVETERQKEEAKELLGGTSGGNVEVEPRDPDQELANKLLADSE